MSTLKSLIKSLKLMERRLPLYLLAIFMMTALNALFDVAGSVFMKIIFDTASKSCDVNSGQEIIIAIVLGVMSIIFASVFMCIYNNEAKRMSLKLKNIVFEKSMKFPYEYYEEYHSAEILSKMVYDTDVASNIYSSRLRRVVAPIIFVVVFAIAMAVINPFMTIILILFNALLFVTNSLISKPMKIVGKELSQKNSAMTNIIYNIIAGIGLTKIYDVNLFGIEKYKKENNEYTRIQKSKMCLSALLEMLNNGFDLLCSLMFIVIGIILIQYELATIGELAAIYTLYTSLSFRFLQLGKNFPELVNCIAYAERIFEFLDLPEEVLHSENEEKECLSNVPGIENAVNFNNILFGYKDKEKLFLGNTYFFPQNKMIAIIGHSGCGKSTLAKLLLGFYELQGGSISIFGRDSKELGGSESRKYVAYVPQSPYMFNESIMENIRYGNPNASNGEVIQAAKLANAHDFIVKLEKGYDTILNNRGNNLSGGERQRVAIARAILKNSPILLMDEATSALDNESEQLIVNAIAGLKNKKTVIMIAHRMTTIQNADIIVEI